MTPSWKQQPGRFVSQPVRRDAVEDQFKSPTHPVAVSSTWSPDAPVTQATPTVLIHKSWGRRPPNPRKKGLSWCVRGTAPAGGRSLNGRGGGSLCSPWPRPDSLSAPRPTLSGSLVDLTGRLPPSGEARRDPVKRLFRQSLTSSNLPGRTISPCQGSGGRINSERPPITTHYVAVRRGRLR